MKKKIIFITVFILYIILTGCEADVKTGNGNVVQLPKPSVSPEISNPIQVEKWPIYKADPQSFYQTSGWVSEHELLLVEVLNGTYILKSYNIKTGESVDFYHEEQMIIDVIIHPSKKFIALHTSDNPSSATIKIISTSGTLINELNLTSAEVYIDWNSNNPSLIVFTAFYEDWSYDTFVFNGNNQELRLIEPIDPFVQWYDDETLLYVQWSDHALGGGTMFKMNWQSGDTEETEITNTVYFDVHNDQVVTVHPNSDTTKMIYQLHDGLDDVMFEWTSPAISNYSQWFVPEVEWLEDGSLITMEPNNVGLLDDTEAYFQFVKVKDELLQTIDKKLEFTAFNCSPTGEYCLSGYDSDELIVIETKESFNWIEYEE